MNKQTDTAWKYWAFLSYSHRDKPVADWLHKALESYRIPKKLVGQIYRLGSVPTRVFPIFRDREELPTSSDLGSQIQDALRQSRFIIVVASPHAATSRWVNEEIRFFKHHHGEERVLSLIADGEPNTSAKESSGSLECFPPALRFRVAPDGSLTGESVEPIAADLRPDGDGKNNSVLKIVAGLTGLAFDALRQRDRDRARKRAYGAVSAAVLLCAAAFVLANRISEIEKRQSKLEKSQQAQGNITKPFSEMRLADPSRQSFLDDMLADLHRETEAFHAWLCVSNQLNPKLNINTAEWVFPPPTNTHARLASAQSYNSLQQALMTEQKERRNSVKRKVNSIREQAKTPEERLYVDNAIRQLEGAIESTEFSASALVQVNQLKFLVAEHVAELKLNKRGGSLDFHVLVQHAEQALAEPAITDAALKRLLRDEMDKALNELRTADPDFK